MDSIYLYCDIIKPMLVADTEAQLLRSVLIPNNLKFGDRINPQLNTYYYLTLIKNEFDSIEIDVKDKTGRTIDFGFGNINLRLHFRQKQNLYNELCKLLR
jgi:hypothetical protein